ncbi:MAG: FAD-binding protein, partial [Pseudomonadota bacterium]
MTLVSATPAFLETLATDLPPETLTAPAPRYLEEPRGRYHGQAAAVARPRTTAEVSRILAACNAARVPAIPYGGGTGLVG